MLTLDENQVLKELKSREPIFHHPNRFGTTKQAILDQMDEAFWEVGASGQVYTKQDVLETLLIRYQDPHYRDVWETSDFKLRPLAMDYYLLTYILIQDESRITRRSTLWRRTNERWVVVYHQGTIVG